ncbi:galactokinase [Corynebacterium xerosis]|uniref:galactokinase n=1 Tax=Corynebacterium xerosis TaxID=1725 RepID=UPI00365F5F03
MTLADGRELIYFDDEPDFVEGRRTRKTVDDRRLPEAVTESELRRDPLTGEWNVYAAHRMNRTFMPPANENPLAPTKQGELPTEIPADDYDVVVFENRFPSLSMHMEVPEDFAAAVDGEELFPRRPALARCEVVCFTPDVTSNFRDLPYSRARTVVEAWAHRTRELSEIDGVRLVFPFENRGKEIGVTLQHPHGQIYSYPYLPSRAASIVAASKTHEAETGRSLFDDVLSAEKRSGRRIIAEGEHFTAFVPAAAKWPVEVMLMANRAVPDFAALTDDEKDELTRMYLDLLGRMDRFFEGVERTPYIAAWNQAPVGEDRVHGRLHLQLYSMMRSPGRMKFLAGSESGQGAWISDTTPERIADRFREIGGAKWSPTRDDATGAADATALFKTAFDSAPAGVWAAPGRVNLIGEHVDYAGGICLPFALSQRTWVAVSPREDGLYRLVSDMGGGEPQVVEIGVDEVGPGSPSDWTGYVVGAIWAQQEAGLLPEQLGGFDIAVTSDVPIGGGLSSSAALECSAALAAYELTVGPIGGPADDAGSDVRAGLVAACIRAENEVVGASTGGLDQRISLFGQAGNALAIDYADDSAVQVPCDLPSHDLAILVIDTKAPHFLADGQYASRRGVIDAVTEGLGVGSLRECDDALGAAAEWAAANVPDGTDAGEWERTVVKRVRHVVSEIERTAKAIGQLKAGDMAGFGESMCASHASLRDDYEVTCLELDLAVDTAMAHGAVGARMTGGGFGGSAIALVDAAQVEPIADAIAEAYAEAGFRPPEFLAAVPSDGAEKIG